MVETLNSIKAHRPSFAYEVIVVDNGSTDDTSEVCTKLQQQGLPLTYVYEDVPGLLSGRHRGATMAKAPIVCFLDDDVVLSSTWFTGVEQAFSDRTVQLATGPCLPRYEANPPEWLDEFWTKMPGHGKACSWLSLMDLGNRMIDLDPTMVWGLNFCIRKQTLFELGGFHPDNIPAALQAFQGDGETGLTLKARQAQLKAVYHPAIAVEHIVSSGRLTETYFLKRAFYQGVCDSFTELRTQNHPVTLTAITPTHDVNTSFAKNVRSTFSGIKRQLFPRRQSPLSIRLKAEEKKGYDFHQEAFKTDLRVREWVLKPDYWDYKLPV